MTVVKNLELISTFKPQKINRKIMLNDKIDFR